MRGNDSGFHKCPSQINQGNVFTMVCSCAMRNIAGIHPGHFPSTLDTVFLKGVNNQNMLKAMPFIEQRFLKCDF